MRRIKKVAQPKVDAIKKSVKWRQCKTLTERIKEGAIARSERDLKMAEQWFWIEEEIYQEES